ncbi:hypothetical protein GLA29479_2187 [Lysobacter antibioticus]|nr:hypothetical protein GLA29479_2187 [Lysobacter antibioticus]
MKGYRPKSQRGAPGLCGGRGCGLGKNSERRRSSPTGRRTPMSAGHPVTASHFPARAVDGFPIRPRDHTPVFALRRILAPRRYRSLVRLGAGSAIRSFLFLATARYRAPGRLVDTEAADAPCRRLNF